MPTDIQAPSLDYAALSPLFLVLGFYPKPMLDVINPAVEATLQDVGLSDPAPTATDAATENR